MGHTLWQSISIILKYHNYRHYLILKSLFPKKLCVSSRLSLATLVASTEPSRQWRKRASTGVASIPLFASSNAAYHLLSLATLYSVGSAKGDNILLVITCDEHGCARCAVLRRLECLERYGSHPPASRIRVAVGFCTALIFLNLIYNTCFCHWRSSRLSHIARQY